MTGCRFFAVDVASFTCDFESEADEPQASDAAAYAMLDEYRMPPEDWQRTEHRTPTTDASSLKVG